jgi:hypothetical protein
MQYTVSSRRIHVDHAHRGGHRRPRTAGRRSRRSVASRLTGWIGRHTPMAWSGAPDGRPPAAASRRRSARACRRRAAAGGPTEARVGSARRIGSAPEKPGSQRNLVSSEPAHLPGFARNVCVGLGNWGSPAAVPVLLRALSDPEPLVREHAGWALGRVGSAEARSALSRHVSVEADATVLAELSAALGA